MEVLLLVIGVLFGLIVGAGVGIFIGMERMRKAVEEQSVGSLRIDRSEPDEPPKPFLEVKQGVTIDMISRMKIVMLQVINENYISSN